MLPYFKRAEDNQRFADLYHGYGGPLGVSAPVNPLPVSEAFLRAAQELGIPYNPDFNGEIPGRDRALPGDGARCAALLRRDRLSQADPPSPQSDGPDRRDRHAGSWSRAGAPSASSLAEVHRCGREREVLVTAGAIGSPRLLMLSGIGPADHLTSVGLPVVHDLPGVGSNLQDHLDLYAIAECTGDHSYDGYARPHRTALGRAGISPVPPAARSPPPCSRPAASGMATAAGARPRDGPISSSISASARASRRESRG